MICKFLVITAMTDESQFSDLCRSIEHQVDVQTTHEVITGKGAIEAEREIYRISRLFHDKVDFIIRLDADMVLIHVGFFRFLNEYFKVNKNVCRVSLPVEDYFTGRQIMGVHCWRASSTPVDAKIDPPKPEAWIDRISGRTFFNTPVAFVKHAWGPSNSQAVRFGLHRSIKALSAGPFHGHWSTLRALYCNWYKDSSEPGLCYAMYSALIAISEEKYREWSVLSAGSKENVEIISKVADFVKSGVLFRLLLKKFGFLNIYRISNYGYLQYLMLLCRELLKDIRSLFEKLKWIWMIGLLRRKGVDFHALLGGIVNKSDLTSKK